MTTESLALVATLRELIRCGIYTGCFRFRGRILDAHATLRSEREETST